DIHPLSLHDALPISHQLVRDVGQSSDEGGDRPLGVHQRRERLEDLAAPTHADRGDFGHAVAATGTASRGLYVDDDVLQRPERLRSGRTPVLGSVHQMSSRMIGRVMQRPPPPPRTSSAPSNVMTAFSSSSISTSPVRKSIEFTIL